MTARLYRKKSTLPEFEKFYLPFGGKLRSDNRWVIMGKLMPWDEVEQKYAMQFHDCQIGAPAKSARVALGSLMIKERLKTTDEETVEQIKENPYLQFFLGYQYYSDEQAFDPSMMVYFQQSFVADPSGYSTHQHIVVHTVEELFQVDVYDPGVALLDVALRLLHRLMCRSSRPEPVAVITERRVPTLLQDLQHRLLHESIHHCRDAELPRVLSCSESSLVFRLLFLLWACPLARSSDCVTKEVRR